jgi:hypothetical protein
VGEGGIISKQAMCGRVRLGRRDTPDKNLGLVVDVQASVLLENQLDVREHFERNGELGLDVIVISVGYCAGVLVVLVEGAPPEVMDGEAKDDHFEGVSLLSDSLTPDVKYVPAKVEVTQVGLGGAYCFEVFKHSTQLFANSLNIVTLAKALNPLCPLSTLLSHTGTMSTACKIQGRSISVETEVLLA